MKKLFLSLIIILFANSNFAQDSSKVSPVQFTFFYPLASNGIHSPKIANNFSFNCIYGINGGVQGFELGSIANINTGDVLAVQIAGIANVNKKKTDGIIIGGIANVMQDSMQGIAVAGISNINGASVLGLSVAGINNTVNGSLLGAQFAGIANTANGDVVGAQVAGISNTNNGSLLGLQLSGVSNVTIGDLTGAQIGLVNRAANVKGFQLGLINISDSFEQGVPFGLFSYVKDGYHAIEVAGGEMIQANLSFKLGVEKLYSIYKVGYSRVGNQDYFSYGHGFGSILPITEKVSVSIDLSANHIVKPNDIPRLNILGKGDFSIRYQINDLLDVFIGPSLNVFVSEFLNDGQSNIEPPYTFYEENWWNNDGKTALWVGGNVGLNIHF
ncbi:LA_2272 family surface repeat-containing protein [Crocinitomix catalasitica]|uniref:LA_2272 family surface repeat-containing protein n=1 Tax=Crocinitomix catalasitica TaxID=184607 RepID=UPI0012F7AA84|nr:hypothetical protein [Crocinitomix catalasitica]